MKIETKNKNLFSYCLLCLSSVIVITYATVLQNTTSDLNLYLRSLTEAAVLTVTSLILISAFMAQKPLKLILFFISAFFSLLFMSIIDIKWTNQHSKVDESTINIVSFSKLGRNKDTNKLRSFTQSMNDKNMHIIALQEVTEDELLPINNQEMYLSINKGRSTAIYSRWPIEEINYKKNRFHIIRTNGYVFINVHMPKFFLDFEIYKTRFNALQELLKKLKQEKVILLGDLNITKYDTYYRSLIQQNFVDSYAKSGHGIGYTFPAKGRRLGWLGAFLRIDYILVKNITPIQSYRLDQSYGSDHYPIVAVLRSE